MQGLIFKGDQRLDFYDFPKPQPGKGEILVKVCKAAVCGTDIHKYRLSEKEIPMEQDGTPIACGHEPAGWVAEVGEGIDRKNIGQRVMLAGVIGCGKCDQCLTGYNTACTKGVKGLYWNYPGCNTTYVVMPAINILPIPDDLSFEVASLLTCAGGTAITIIEDTGLKSGDKLAIIGLGPVGLCLAILAKSIGVTVVGVDVSNYRIELAQNLGIDLLVNSKNSNTQEAIAEWTNNQGCQVVAECVGKASTQQQCFDIVSNRGTIALAGVGDEDFNANLGALAISKGGIRLVGIAATPIIYFKKLIQVAAELNSDFEKIITHRFNLSEAEKAFELMEEGECGKVILEIAQEF